MRPSEQLPPDFEAQSKQRFEKLERQEVAFEKFFEFEKQEFLRRKHLAEHPELQYLPFPTTMTPCGNGDFDTTLNPAEWQGAYGSLPLSSGSNPFATFTAGLVGGPLSSGASHQTRVGAGVDPSVPIPLTAQGSAGAVRIGNSDAHWACDVLSKTFTVAPGQGLIKFWYALVLGQCTATTPFFWVRVTDASGIVIPGAVNLGNGSDKLVADPSNPFFHPHPVWTTYYYKDWACAQINVSAYVGQTVTVQFAVSDCELGMHCGYAYIDSFCGNCSGSPEGNLTLDDAASTKCGPGKLCFNYELPHVVNPGGASTTGTITISLNILQSGVVLGMLTSPVLSSGHSYCFTITPASLPGINTSLAGFDFVATGAFAIGSTNLAPMSVGSAPYGVSPGFNNDYQISCFSRWCCPGDNVLHNGDFEAGNTGFSSQYTFNPATTVNATVPGQYNIVNSAQAATISPLWVATDQYLCKGGAGTSKFMVVNGKTCQTGSKRIWKETVPVREGSEYRFCANFKNFPQCTFDIKPKVDVRFSVPPNIPPTVISTTSNACDWYLISSIVMVPWGTTSLTIEIWLDETGLGDGNDLAIDDISLQLMPPVNSMYTLVNLATTIISGNQYTVTATPVNPVPLGYGYYWEVTEIDSIGNPVPGTMVTNPSAWWTYPAPCDFKGYVGTSTLGSTSIAGKFSFAKRYRITYGVWSACESWAQSTWLLQFNVTTKKAEVSQIAPTGREHALPLAARGKGIASRG